MQTLLAALPTSLIALAGLAAALVIAHGGSRLARAADRLADATGLGEAIFGAVLLGGATSLPGIITSITAGYGGYADLAVSNALGGIAAQTVFLVVADIAYRGTNLEHAAASLENLIQGALLAALLTLPVLAATGPASLTVLGVHPASVLLILGYLTGLRLVAQNRTSPQWTARLTPATRPDRPDSGQGQDRRATLRVWVAFGGLAVLVGSAGYLVAHLGIVLIERFALSGTVVGALGTGIVTSLPELITTVAAVRQGALTLAVGNIIGGNAFDVLFVAFADVAYREGSIYHAITGRELFMVALAQLLTGVLVLGLLSRQRRGPANIGFESILVLVLYLAGMALLTWGGG
jgi:cation:H+ antiporter